MKYTQLVLILICTSLSSIAQKNSKNVVAFSSPVEYNNYIVYKQQDVIEKVLSFSSVQELSKKEEIIDVTIPKITQHLKDIQNMPAWQGNVDLKNKSIALFSFYKKTFQTSYKNVLNLMKNSMTKEKETKIKQIVENITAEEAKLDEAFKKSQQAFAKKYNMQIDANPLQKQIDSLKN